MICNSGCGFARGPVALMAAISFASVAASGQDAAPSWGAMAGVESATGTLSGLAPGIAIGVLAQQPFLARQLALRTDVMFSSIGNNACGDHCDATFAYSFLVSASFSLIARLNDPATRWSPYAIAGGTAYIAESLPHLGIVKPDHFGFEGGLGFEVRLSQHTVFAEARYMGISPGAVVPVTVGIRF